MQVAKMFPVRKGSHPGKLLDHSPATSISLSKLADESQLGSLSKLLTPAHNNNVNDCNYDAWPSEGSVDPVNSCSKQYESSHQYKSFMPLKKRFRQDFTNEILKESSTSSIDTIANNQLMPSESNSSILLEDIDDMVPLNHCAVKIETTSEKLEEIQEGRTTKFRACKGERYKMFMNSNRRTRNKTNSRWELRQKSIPPEKLTLDGEVEFEQRINDLSNLDMEDYNKAQNRNRRPKKISKTKRKKRQLSPTKTISIVDNLQPQKDESDCLLDNISKVRQVIKEEKDEIKEEHDDPLLNEQLNGNNNNLLNNKENGIFDCDDDGSNQVKLVHEVKEEDNEIKSLDKVLIVENIDKKTGTVVGSRKRKLRKQNIMRLQPGSTFKDMRVVEDSVICDLGTLADVAVSSEQKRIQSTVTT